MQALMLGKATTTILEQIEKLENDNKELKDTIASERALQVDYSYNDIRKWLSHFRTLDYTKIKHRKDLLDALVYKVILYDDKFICTYNYSGEHNEVTVDIIEEAAMQAASEDMAGGSDEFSQASP